MQALLKDEAFVENEPFKRFVGDMVLSWRIGSEVPESSGRLLRLSSRDSSAACKMGTLLCEPVGYFSSLLNA